MDFVPYSLLIVMLGPPFAVPSARPKRYAICAAAA